MLCIILAALEGCTGGSIDNEICDCAVPDVRFGLRSLVTSDGSVSIRLEGSLKGRTVPEKGLRFKCYIGNHGIRVGALL